MRPTIVIAYDATPAAADGLALGRLLADLVDARAARRARAAGHPFHRGDATAAAQAWFRTTLHETQRGGRRAPGRPPRSSCGRVFGTPVGARASRRSPPTVART